MPRRRPARVYRVLYPGHRELVATFEHLLDAARYADHLADDLWDVAVVAGRRDELHRSRRHGLCPECLQPWRLYELRQREDEGLPMWGCGLCGARFGPCHHFGGGPFELAAPATYPAIASRLRAQAIEASEADGNLAGSRRPRDHQEPLPTPITSP